MTDVSKMSDREMNEALAPLFGWRPGLGVDGNTYYYHPEESVQTAETLPSYATDGNAMISLNEEMRERGWSWDAENYWVPGRDTRYRASFTHDDLRECDGVASTLPRAVAEAAYLALKSEVKA